MGRRGCGGFAGDDLVVLAGLSAVVGGGGVGEDDVARRQEANDDRDRRSVTAGMGIQGAIGEEGVGRGRSSTGCRASA